MTISKSIISTLALSLVVTTLALATNDLQMGTWKLNEEKSKLISDMGKNTMVVYAATGDKLKMTVDGAERTVKLLTVSG